MSHLKINFISRMVEVWWWNSLIEALADVEGMKMCGGDNRINLYEISVFSMDSPKDADESEAILVEPIEEGRELKRRDLEEKRADGPVEHHCKRYGGVRC